MNRVFVVLFFSLIFIGCVTWDGRLKVVNNSSYDIYIFYQTSVSKVLDNSHCMERQLNIIKKGEMMTIPSQTKWQFLLKDEVKLDIAAFKREDYENYGTCEVINRKMFFYKVSLNYEQLEEDNFTVQIEDNL